MFGNGCRQDSGLGYLQRLTRDYGQPTIICIIHAGRTLKYPTCSTHITTWLFEKKKAEGNTSKQTVMEAIMKPFYPRRRSAQGAMLARKK